MQRKESYGRPLYCTEQASPTCTPSLKLLCRTRVPLKPTVRPCCLRALLCWSCRAWRHDRRPLLLLLVCLWVMLLASLRVLCLLHVRRPLWVLWNLRGWRLRWVGGMCW